MSTTFKGLFHVVLSLLSVVEATTTQRRDRKLLLGACAGYHAHAAVYHFFLEDK
jgi:predicted kinase